MLLRIFSKLLVWFLKCFLFKGSIDKKIIFRRWRSFWMTPWMPWMDSTDNFGPIWFFLVFHLWSSKRNWSSKRAFWWCGVLFCWREHVRKLSQGVRGVQSHRYVPAKEVRKVPKMRQKQIGVPMFDDWYLYTYQSDCIDKGHWSILQLMNFTCITIVLWF